MSRSIRDWIGCHCYLCHANAIFRVGKIPCNCNIIVPLTFADIHARTLLERIQPENGWKLRFSLDENVLNSLVKLNFN